jgi:hypothetical protein
MSDLYFLPSGVPAPSRSWKYSPSTQHVKSGELALPAPSRSWKYSPSTYHLRPIPPLTISPVISTPGGLYLLVPFAGKIVQLGRSIEQDIARGVIQKLSLGRAVEENRSYLLNLTHRYFLGRSLEVDLSYLINLSQPGLGQVTRYVTIELSDKNRRTRRDIHRDIITYSTGHTKVNFVHKAVTDEVRYSQHVDRIFFQKNL